MAPKFLSIDQSQSYLTLNFWPNQEKKYMCNIKVRLLWRCSNTVKYLENRRRAIKKKAAILLGTPESLRKTKREKKESRVVFWVFSRPPPQHRRRLANIAQLCRSCWRRMTTDEAKKEGGGIKSATSSFQVSNSLKNSSGMSRSWRKRIIIIIIWNSSCRVPM